MNISDQSISSDTLPSLRKFQQLTDPRWEKTVLEDTIFAISDEKPQNIAAFLRFSPTSKNTLARILQNPSRGYDII